MTTNLPAAFATGPSDKFKSVAPRASLAEGIGQSYAIIGYRGKTWSLRYRGEEYNILRDDGTPSGVLDVIILRAAPMKSKSYYKDWKPGDNSPPLCSSIDGVVPDDAVPAKQSETCALCPQNEFKVMPDGKKRKQCSDYKRLAVLVMPDYTAAVLGGVPLIEPVFLRVPAASLNDLATFGEEMEAKGYDFSSFVTRIKFDPDKSHPQMLFEALKPLNDEEADVVLPLIDNKTALRVTGEDQVTQPRLAAPAPVAQLAAPVTPAVSPPAAAQVAPLPPATPVQIIIPPKTKIGLVAAAKAAAITVPVTPAPAAVQATVADTEAPPPDDLDARVKALLNTGK